MPGMPGSLALCIIPPADDDEACRDRSPRFVATCPALRVVVPRHAGDLGLEQGVLVEVEVPAEPLAVARRSRSRWRTSRSACSRSPPAAGGRCRTRRRTCSPGSGSSTRCRRSRRPSRGAVSRARPAWSGGCAVSIPAKPPPTMTTSVSSTIGSAGEAGVDERVGVEIDVEGRGTSGRCAARPTSASSARGRSAPRARRSATPLPVSSTLNIPSSWSRPTKREAVQARAAPGDRRFSRRSGRLRCRRS